jgi:hypothetical protein
MTKGQCLTCIPGYVLFTTSDTIPVITCKPVTNAAAGSCSSSCYTGTATFVA